MEYQELPVHIRQYLNERCVKDKVLDALNVKWAFDGSYNWIAFPVFNIDGKVVYHKLKAPPDALLEQSKYKTWPVGSYATLYPLFHLSEAKRVYLCEGEPDALVMLSYSLEAVSSTHGVGTFKEEWLDEFPKNIEVVISFDLDDAGKKGEGKVVEMIRRKRPDIILKRLNLPEHLGKGGDITNLAEYCKRYGQNFVETVVNLIEDIQETHESKEPEGTPILSCLANIEPEEVRWLWKSRIPRGKITIFDGDPGLGKSWCSLAVASAITKGLPLPGDGNLEIRKPGDVLLLTAEDGLADTISNRLAGMDVDQNRIFALEGVRDEKGGERQYSLTDDLQSIEQALDNKEFALIIIDPLNAYLGASLDTHRDAALRSVLMPVARLAERRDVAVLCIRHLTKSSKDKAIYRGLGSIGGTAAARVVLMMGEHPHEKDQRIVSCIKNNLAPHPLSVAFELKESTFKWIGETDIVPDVVMGDQKTGGDFSALDDAKSFLLEVLWEDSLSAKEVYEQAKELSISKRTLDRARTELGVRSVKIGSGKEGYWKLELPKDANSTNEDWQSLKENSPFSSYE